MRALLSTLLLALIPFGAAAIEEPDYEVVQQLDGAEVRQYAPYVVAQVKVSGAAELAGVGLTGSKYGSGAGIRSKVRITPSTMSSM